MHPFFRKSQRFIKKVFLKTKAFYFKIKPKCVIFHSKLKVVANKVNSVPILKDFLKLFFVILKHALYFLTVTFSLMSVLSFLVSKYLWLDNYHQIVQDVIAFLIFIIAVEIANYVLNKAKSKKLTLSRLLTKFQQSEIPLNLKKWFVFYVLVDFSGTILFATFCLLKIGFKPLENFLLGVIVITSGLLVFIKADFIPFVDKFYLKVKIFLLQKIKFLANKVYQKFQIWWPKFKIAPPKQKAYMLRIPIAIILAIYLFNRFGSAFAPPQVVVTFPGEAASEIPLDSVIEVQFNKDMNQKSVENAFKLEPDIDGEFSWQGKNRLIFTPKEPFARQETYLLKIGGLSLSKLYIPQFKKYEAAFTTLGHPKVLVASPQTEALKKQTAITVMFDRAMIPLTTYGEKEAMMPAFKLDPPLEGEGKWLGTTAYQFRPSEELDPATTYTYTVEAGMKSVDGGEIQEPETFSFSTPRPRVLATSPKEEYQYANPVASVSATLSLPIDLESAQDKFHLYELGEDQGSTYNYDETADYVEVPATVKVSGNQIGLYPNQPLKRGTRYMAKIKEGLQSTAGPNGTDYEYSWSFAVAPKAKILGSTPKNGASNVHEQHRAEVKFNVPMDEDSFKGNVIISPAPDRSPSLYFYSYSGNELNIGTYFGRSTDYTVTVKGNVTDQYGVPLGYDYTFAFDTAAFKPSISIQPTGTYFASFNQDVVPRIVTKVTNSNFIDYSLYKLDQEEFIKLYRYRYDYNYTRDSSLSSWQGYDPSHLESVRNWRETYDAQQNVPVNVITKVEQADGSRIPSGLYFLDTSIGEGVHDNMVMVVSKTALTLKTSDKQALVWAVNQSSGEVVPDMQVDLMRVSGKPFLSGKTNQDGVYLAATAKELYKGSYKSSTDPVIAFARKDDDISVVIDAWDEGIARYDFGLSSYYDSQESDDYRAKEELKIHLQLDRPIYRPGQTVYYKGVVRMDDDGLYDMPPDGSEAEITVTDAAQKEVHREKVRLNTYGTFSGEFTLSEEGSVGNYSVRAEVKNNGFRQSFQVEEYKRADFELELNTEKTSYVSGESLEGDLTASYYFGAPVADAELDWTITTQDKPYTWHKDRYFDFGDADNYWYSSWWSMSNDSYYSGNRIAEGEGKTDHNGMYEFKIPVNISDKSSSQKLRLEAVVRDDNNNVIASSKVIDYHHAALQVGLKPESYSSKPGEEARVELVTVDLDGQEKSDRAVKVSFYKRTWKSVKEYDEDDDRYYWTSKPFDEFIEDKDVTTDAYGRARVSFVPETGGSYRVVAESSDDAGRTAKSATFVWVSGYTWGPQRQNHDRILMIPNKQEYNVDEEATVQAVLPYENMTGLITVERASVFDYKVEKFTKDDQSVNIGIKNRYVPNAYISGTFVKGGNQVKDPAQFKLGYTEIKVNNPKTKVDISVNTDKARYNPGDKLKVNLETRDGSGTPVQTEIAVALVDKAVWDLASTKLADIYKTFYQPRNLEVWTSNLLTISMDRINANINLGSKGGSGGGCFTGGTTILMADGSSKPIAEVAAGDEVLTRESKDSAKLVSAKVEKVMIHDVDGYLVINGDLEVTGVHRVYTNKGWLTADKLKKGHKLLDKDNNWVKVKSIEKVSSRVRVYNIEIEKYHTYFAGDVWVHNDKGDGWLTARDEFLDTAYWNAHVETDANGKAYIEVDLPDNTTTWRLMAVAVNKDTAVGDQVEEVMVTKDMLIQPMLPRFLSVGDEAKLGMTVHNTTDSDQDVTAEIMTEGVKFEGAAVQTTTIPANSHGNLFWETVTENTDEATVMFSVKGMGLEDAIKVSLPVKSYYVPEVVATSGEAADVAQETVFLPSDIAPDQGELAITLSASLGSGVQDAADYILKYPYWCNEQTISKVTPLVHLLEVARDAELEEMGGYQIDTLEKLVSNGLQRLSNSQLPDGGWGWWSGPEYHSSPYVSAIVMDGLISSQEFKYDIDDSVVNRGVGYLESELNDTDNSLELKAFLASIIARKEKVDPGVLSNLMDRRWQMSLTGRAYLLRAMQDGGGSRRDRQRLLDELTSVMDKTNTTAHWEDSKIDWRFMSGDITLTALMLESLTKENRRHALIPDVTRYLMQARKDGHWGTTRENAAAVKAIVTMLKARSETKPNESYIVDLGDERLFEGEFKKEDLFKQVKHYVSLADIPKEQDLNLKVQKSGKGSLYYNYNLKYFLPFTEVEPMDQGIVIDRELIDGKGKRLSDEQVEIGDEIWVRLTVVMPATRHHVVIEDKLPAGFEPINESLATTALSNVEVPSLSDTIEETGMDPYGYGSEAKKPRSLYFRRKEIRDDRVVLFAETVPAGVYEYQYRVRPSIPGKFHYPPVEAFNMYMPDISGHSSGGWIELVE